MIPHLVKCMGLRRLLVGGAAVLAGTAAASYAGNFDFVTAFLCLIFILTAQIASHFHYRYNDEKRGFGENIDSGMTQPGDEFPLERVLREASAGFAIISVMIGFALISMVGWWLVVSGLIMAAMLYFNNSGPAPLSRTPYALVACFFFFGPFCVLTTYFVQTCDQDYQNLWNWSELSGAIWMSIALGAFGVNAWLSNDYTNYQRDLYNGRRTLPVVRGRKTSRWIFRVNGLVEYGMAWTFCMLFHRSHWPLVMIVPSLCFIFNIYLSILMMKKPRLELGSITDRVIWNSVIYALNFLIFSFIYGINDGSSHSYFSYMIK